MSKEISVNHTSVTPAFADAQGFDLAQRVAKALSESNLIPIAYKGNVSNCLVALEYSHRVKMSVLAVMQNLHIISGKPTPSSAFIIAAINTCGRFAPLKFKLFGAGDQRGCIAWTTDASGDVLESPAVSIEMAKKEGWYTRTASKWPSMPELMLRYRAAAFFGRLYAPEIILGMHSAEEAEDMRPAKSNAALDALADEQPSYEDVEVIDVVPQKKEQPITERVAKMLTAFAAYGVSRSDIEKRMGKPTDNFLPEDVAGLAQIFSSLKEGQSKPTDWFVIESPTSPE